ncbi:MAG: GIY-YIG nuclease family protein [Yokenella regensburgei]|nr:GIY-YIG nuclease family protein [Yokenella regensburgei]
MAGRKKGNVSAAGVLILLGVIVWLIYVIIRGLAVIHDAFIMTASGPKGLIVLFLILQVAVFILVRMVMLRKVKARTEEVEREKHELDIKEQHFELRVKNDVESAVRDKRAQLEHQQRTFNDAKNKATRTLQRIVDAAYKFKVKTLLAGTTINNWQAKYDQLKKEVDAYAVLREKITYLQLEDNADWAGVKQQFLDKVAILEKAQEEKEYQDEIKRQMRDEKQRQDELDRRQREAEEAERRLAEQQRLLEEALLAAEGAHREELERQRLALEQQIQDVHQQYERAKSMAQLTRQGHVYIISNIGSFGEHVYKVGMTRRLEPMDRVKELSDASVPFDFDVHAMISCDDAPALEKTLHDHLERYRMNKINLRKEFFRVELNEIIHEVERHHGRVDYIADPVALQYWQSQESAETDAA